MAELRLSLTTRETGSLPATSPSLLTEKGNKSLILAVVLCPLALRLIHLCDYLQKRVRILFFLVFVP